MQIRSTYRQPTKPLAKKAVEPEKKREEAPFDPGVTNYHGPVDGRSQTPKNQGIWKPLAKAVVALGVRTEIEGEENLPTEGGNVYALNHSSFMDVPIAPLLPQQDTRFIATIEVFRNKVGAKVAGDMGAFPVNRAKPSRISMKHPSEILQDKKGFLIFPEGTFPEEAGRGGIGPFKKGVGHVAIDGKADSVVPIAIDYQRDRKAYTGERVAGWVAAAAVAGAGILASTGSPLAQTIGGVVTGALTGAAVGGQVGSRTVDNAAFWNPTNKIVAAGKWGAIGAVVGAIGGGLGVGTFGSGFGQALSGTAGLGVAAVARSWRKRPVAAIKIGKPMDVQAFIDKADLGRKERKEAALELTEELHERIGTLKAELSGVPYDHNAQKIAGKGVPKVG